MLGIWTDVLKDVSNQDDFAIVRFLVDKLASSIFEFTDHRLGQGTVSAVGKIETPLMGLGIVETEAQFFPGRKDGPNYPATCERWGPNAKFLVDLIENKLG